MKSLALFSACLFLFSFLLQPVVLNAALELQHRDGNWQSTSVGESSAPTENQSLAPEETQIVALVNGTEAYNNALEMEAIGLNYTLSDYSFRAAGSKGANETARFIMKQFQSFGLETHNESFQFTNWDLLSEPTLIVDEDGNPATTNDQIDIRSFQSTHYSWPTPQGGVFEDLVVLPLPSAANINEIGLNPIDSNTWNTINTTNKILLVGREVTWDNSWHQLYVSKLYSQPPAAVVFTWWYDWMSFTPMMIGSAGGRPISSWGPYYWNLQIPVGGVDYNDGLWIRNRESIVNVSASFKIKSIIDFGPHYNVVGRLRGYAEPDKFVIVSGHYDTVTTPGFCDNGAGAAGVIEAARIFTDAVKNSLYHPKYSIVFVAFDGEEIGLVGAIYYIRQHKAEMPNIVAVINLDCIGNDNFVVSPTNPAGSLDLDQLVLQAAADLSVNAALTEIGGSDQEPFRDPVWANGLLQYWWGINLGIADATPVESSAGLASEPLLYSDKWLTGTPGWIHTSYDNSSSTQTFGWVEVDALQNHIKITVLSIARVSPTVSVHDIAVTNIACSKNTVSQGGTLQINVTVRNLGDFSETFNVTIYANSTLIEKRATNLALQTQEVLSFTWNTTGFAQGNYTIRAYASPVQGELDITNNTLVDGNVIVTVPSDTTPPTIGTPSRNPSGTVNQGQTVKISVNIIDTNTGVKNATLLYTINNGSSWETPITMNHNATTGYYETVIPGKPAGTFVKYQIIAYDNAGNYKVENNAGQYYVYTVVPEFPQLLILPFFMIATLLALVLIKRRKTLNNRQK